tara:strand:- start:6341 stop:7105 length:765 start_codon:yes stop_codon:yes gene_type:complete
LSDFKKLTNFVHDTWLLGWYEIKSKYSRSTLGPFWITLNTLILISGLSIVSYSLFGMPMGKMVPWIGFGIITWNYILTTVDESTTIFLSPILLNIRTSPFKFSLINIFKNVIIFSHNLIVAIPIILIFKIDINLNSLFIIYGFFILFINSINFSILIGFLCLRFRDFILIIKNIFYLLFLMTPIFWMPDVLTGLRVLLIDINILFHLIQTVRQPLLGLPIDKLTYLVSISFTIFSSLLCFLINRRYKKFYIFWQ